MNTLPAIETRIFCQAPPVFPGDPANVTCHFPEDLRHSRTSFGLFQRATNGQYEEPVISCRWDDGQPQCVGEEGFHLASNVSDEVTVGIPSSKPKTFFCDTIHQNKNVIVTSCNFTFKASSTPSPTTVPPSLTEAPKTTEGRGDSDGHLFVTIQEVVIVGLVVADLLVIVIVLLWLRRRRRRKSEDSHTRGLQPASVEEVSRLPTEEERRRESEKDYISTASQTSDADSDEPLLGQKQRRESEKDDISTASQSSDADSDEPLLGQKQRCTSENIYISIPMYTSDEESPEHLLMEKQLPTFGDKFNRESQPASDE